MSKTVKKQIYDILIKINFILKIKRQNQNGGFAKRQSKYQLSNT